MNKTEEMLEKLENFSILFAWTYCVTWEANGNKIKDLKVTQIVDAFRKSESLETPTADKQSQ